MREHLDDVLPVLAPRAARWELPARRDPPGLDPEGRGRTSEALAFPNVVDRIVQQAVHQVLSPHYEPTFHASSHGFRPGRSCHTAIAEAARHLEEGYEWVVDLDLEKFFDRVHHQRLMARLAQRVEDRRLLALIRRMLKAKVVMPDGVVVSTEEGAPQGGPLSPLLSNIVLDELDRELDAARPPLRALRRRLQHLRPKRACGQRVMASVVRLHREATAPQGERGQERRRATRGAALRRLPSPARAGGRERRGAAVEALEDRIDEKIRELTPRTWGQSLGGCIAQLNAYLRGWIGFFGIAAPKPRSGRSRNLDAHIRRRLRAILLGTGSASARSHDASSSSGCGPRPRGGTSTRGIKSLWALSHCTPVDHGTAQRVLRRARARVAGAPVEGAASSGRRRPGAAHAGAGIAAGGNTDAGIRG